MSKASAINKTTQDTTNILKNLKDSVIDKSSLSKTMDIQELDESSIQKDEGKEAAVRNNNTILEDQSMLMTLGGEAISIKKSPPKKSKFL